MAQLLVQWLNQLYQLAPWFFQWFYNTQTLVVSPIVALVTLVPAGIGIGKYRSRSNLWWIIPCSVIGVAAFLIALVIALAAASYVGG
jgi:VIT1/CCC1 family predicted Fe2+/Mn2+ transporter